LRGRTPGEQRRVTLDVVVTDPAGSPVAGLTAGDFRVFDNGKEVSGVQGVATDAPEVLLLLDAINTSYESFARANHAVAVRVSRPEVGVWTWAGFYMR
jgi:hypothetical protein